MKKTFRLLSFFLSLVMLIGILPMSAFAAGDVAINAANFPDAAFREIVGGYDTDSNGNLSASEIAAVTEINCSSAGITSLKGVEYFTALQELYCYGNQLTSLDVSKNTALEYLGCWDNQLTSLNVRSNTALEILWCQENQLTSLDVSKNTALKHLGCGENQLTSLDVRSNTALEVLWCYSNQLTSLDMSSNTALTELYCDINQLTSLDVSKNTALNTLGCGGNQLTSLDVSQNTALGYLGCWDNQLTSLGVSKNTALTELYCSGNQLASLDVSKNTALEELSCYGNQLTSLGVSKNTALTELYCSSNQLTSLDVSKNTALEELSCFGNQLTSLDVSKNTSLWYLVCSSNQLTSLDVSSNTALEWLECDSNQLTSLDLSNNTALTELVASGNGIQINVNADRTFNLTSLPGFDVTKANNWSGGTVKGSILTVNSGVTKVTYDYATGKGTVSFFLNVKVPAPQGPTVTTAKNYGSGILVEWDAVEGATGYVVYRRAMTKNSTAWTTFARWNNTTNLSFLDTKVYEGTKYQYGVKAYYGSDPTTTTNLSPVGPMSTALVYAKKPAAPASINAVKTAEGVKLTWSEVKGATGYVVYRRAMTKNSTTWTAFARWNNTTALTFTDTKLYAGTKYQYGVKAYYGPNPADMTYVGPVSPMSAIITK